MERMLLPITGWGDPKEWRDDCVCVIGIYDDSRCRNEYCNYMTVIVDVYGLFEF